MLDFFQEFTDAHVESETFHLPVPTDGSLVFPAVTICPVQFYDRWNLQKALLNKVAVKNADGQVNEKMLMDFKVPEWTVFHKVVEGDQACDFAILYFVVNYAGVCLKRFLK